MLQAVLHTLFGIGSYRITFVLSCETFYITTS